MQKRKFDELISHFNRKVSDMSIDQKYKMELLGMISAIGFAHEKELSTNLAEVGTDCISRQAAIDALYSVDEYNARSVKAIKELPPVQPKLLQPWEVLVAQAVLSQPEPQEIGYDDCANALLKMWMDDVLTDGEYNRIADKLRAKWSEKEETE